MSDFFALAEHVAETLDIGPGTRVFEVECGDGAFLLPLYQNGYVVGGMDADAAAVAAASAAMPEGTFSVGPASALDPAAPWDGVVYRVSAASADPDFIRGLVARMFAKATHALALLDAPEEAHRTLVRALAEAGAQAIQVQGPHLFVRV